MGMRAIGSRTALVVALVAGIVGAMPAAAFADRGQAGTSGERFGFGDTWVRETDADERLGFGDDWTEPRLGFGDSWSPAPGVQVQDSPPRDNRHEPAAQPSTPNAVVITVAMLALATASAAAAARAMAVRRRRAPVVG